MSKVKLTQGFYGGGSLQLGAYSYRGFDVIVSDESGGMPLDGCEAIIGLYNMEDDSGQAADMSVMNHFSMTRVGFIIDDMIDSFYDEQKEAEKKTECTCGAKHTSRPSFHADWCDLK